PFCSHKPQPHRRKHGEIKGAFTWLFELELMKKYQTHQECLLRRLKGSSEASAHMEPTFDVYAARKEGVTP
uniref:hypothetical protein n=1 Tax=Pseudomonas aeruginosa TaxID=287 RepID=UPI00397E5111